MPRLSKRNGHYVVEGLKLSPINYAYLELGNTSLEVEVKLIDNRKITDSQRKLIFALSNEISKRTKANSDIVRKRLRTLFSKATGEPEQSLSECNMEYATKLTNFIIDYCDMHRINIDHIVKRE